MVINLFCFKQLDHVGIRYADFSLEYFQNQTSRIHKWTLNMNTGTVTEELGGFPKVCHLACSHLIKQNIEFGAVNHEFHGRKNRFAYAGLIDPQTVKFPGVVKVDLDYNANELHEFYYGEGKFGGTQA